ncbi:hypothetical protein TeGR_g14824 [Tetraparma gracilis]|uniref:PDZ GRASP-type domain-containing protein n=1 Tax=Tetraparma gracilis TaxID=2962635 RepID=A0ABQ6MW16_9STRA|nr:hypothetical protein TeGR_g14824 [Tetraparma gracilis]
MGASESSLSTASSSADGYGDDGYGTSEHPSLTRVGFRCLSIQPASPAAQAGLVTYFDFIVAFRGGGEEKARRVTPEDAGSFAAKVGQAQQAGEPVLLTVYNTKQDKVRKVELRPEKGWGGVGMLGVTIRLDTYYLAINCAVRVLAVHPGPGQKAGLTAEKDYLLGTDAAAFDCGQTLQDALEAAREQGGGVRLYVYDSGQDEVRVADLRPGAGGGALLGCEVGEGYLNSIPEICRRSIGRSVYRAELLATSSSTEAMASFASEELEERGKMEAWERGQREREAKEEATEREERERAVPAAAAPASAADLFGSPAPGSAASAFDATSVPSSAASAFDAPSPPATAATTGASFPPPPVVATESPPRISAATSCSGLPPDPALAFLPPPPLSHVDSPQQTR